ncbi:MAG: hypothetical protein IT323_13585 [Anaerolineae bacterium]|nr:hypothetical protein [Anaerolineae bacterium]
MATEYEIRVRDASGAQIASINRFTILEYTLVENDVGSLFLTRNEGLPYEFFKTDVRLEVWRSIDGGPARLEGDTVWFVRKPELQIRDNRMLYITAYDAKHLLKRRVVAYKAGTSQAQKSGAASNLMKAIVRENLGSTATDTARRLSFFQVAADNGAGYSTSKAFSYRQVMTVLQELARDSAANGSYLSFDVVRTGDAAGTLEFRTYLHMRGNDHRHGLSPAPVLLSPDTGTLANITLADDAVEEVTFAYALGQGEGAARDVQTASNTARIGVSPYNRIEAAVEATNVALGDTASLLAEAKARLREGRLRRSFAGELRETPDLRYGVHFGFGDAITAQVGRYAFNCRIDKVRVYINAEQGEAVNVNLRNDELL